MLSVLTGTGLSAAAGLNAYIPLLLVGLVARYTDLLPLGDGWRWLENPITLGVLGVLLVVEFLADKFPAVDSVNDVVQSFVRPTSGGVTFGAGASSVSLQEVATAHEAAGDDGSLWPLVAGAVIALALHVVKALARPVINVVTAGIGGAVTSLAEDFSSLALAVFAVVIPIAIVLFIPVFVCFVGWVARKRRQRRERRRTSGPTETSHDVPVQQPPGLPSSSAFGRGLLRSRASRFPATTYNGRTAPFDSSSTRTENVTAPPTGQPAGRTARIARNSLIGASGPARGKQPRWRLPNFPARPRHGFPAENFCPVTANPQIMRHDTSTAYQDCYP